MNLVAAAFDVRSRRWALVALTSFFAACSSSNTEHLVKQDLGGTNDLTTGGDDIAVGDLADLGGDQGLPAPDGFSLPDGFTLPDGGIGVLGTPTAISFGNGNCGGLAPSPQPLTLTNTGTASLTFTANLDNTQFTFGVLPLGDSVDGSGNLTGTIAAGDSQTIQLLSSPIPQTATAGATVTGNFNITATSGGVQGNQVQVPITVTPFGVTLEVTPAGDPTNTYGQVTPGTTASAAPITITNTGNDAATITLGVSSNPSYSATVPGGVAGSALAASGGVVSVTATFSPAAPQTASTATIPITQVGTPQPICGASASQLTFTGSAPANLGVTASPTALTWTVDCGATGTAAKDVTIFNGASSPQPLTVALKSGGTSGFKFTPDPAPTTITKGTPVVIAVTPPVVCTSTGTPAGCVSGVTADKIAPILDTLVITSNTTTIDVALQVNPEGAIITWVNPPADGTIPLHGEIENTGFPVPNVLQAIQNTGNLPAAGTALTLAATATTTTATAADGAFSAAPASFPLEALGAPSKANSQNLEIGYKPATPTNGNRRPQSDPNTGKLTVTQTTAPPVPLCQALPAALNLTYTP